MKKEQVLLHRDNNRIAYQRDFIESLIPKLNELLKAFYSSGMNTDFTLNDLDNIYRGNADQIIKQKLLPKIEGADVGGLKLNTSKLLDMVDMGSDLELFKSEFRETQSFIKQEIEIQKFQRSTVMEFDAKFFLLKDNGVAIDESYFKTWCIRNCEVWTRNNTQLDVYNELLKVCDGLNSLMNIKRSDEADFSSNHFNAESLRGVAKEMTDRENNLGQLIKFINGKFVVDYEFVIRH